MSDKASVFIATPVYEKLDCRMVGGVEQAIGSSELVGRFLIDRGLGDTLIARVRAAQLRRFMDSGCGWYCQLSGDIEVMNRVVGDNFFDRLLRWGKDFVGALYAKSGEVPERGKNCTSHVLAEGWRGRIGRDELVPVRWLSGGVWMVRRGVIDRMVERYGEELSYRAHAGGPLHYALFLEYLYPIGIRGDGGIGEERIMLSEDYAFCERWRALGGEIWADLSVRVKHWGSYGWEL